jgi:50S ribosomal subunit-associated GTPase HflX
MDEMLEDDPLRRIRLRVPQQEGKILSLIQARARVLSREYRDGMVELEARAPESVLRRLKAFVVE